MITHKSSKYLILLLILFNIGSYAYFVYVYHYSGTGYHSAMFVDYPQGNYKAVQKALLPYAQRGDLNARYYLGKMNALGQGKSPNLKQADDWFHCGNNASCIPGEAEFFLGMELLRNRELDTKVDRTTGLCWIQKSAAKGFPYAVKLVNQ